MSHPLDAVRNRTRALAAKIMARVDRLTGGRLTPSAVTMTGLIMHVPIAALIAVEQNYWAAILLVVFGLFDVLDGALAKVQGSTSERGMLLDASTDRFKEVMLYGGAAVALSGGANAKMGALAAVVACGASICVSYVKAKGEAAVASMTKQIPHTVLNRMFSDGLLTFEIRMAILVIGLLTGQLFIAVAVIAVLASFTAIQRLVKISHRL